MVAVGELRSTIKVQPFPCDAVRLVPHAARAVAMHLATAGVRTPCGRRERRRSATAPVNSTKPIPDRAFTDEIDRALAATQAAVSSSEARIRRRAATAPRPYVRKACCPSANPAIAQCAANEGGQCRHQRTTKAACAARRERCTACRAGPRQGLGLGDPSPGSRKVPGSGAVSARRHRRWVPRTAFYERSDGPKNGVERPSRAHGA